MRVSYSMFVGQYNPPANEGYDKLRGQVFVVARKPHEPDANPFEPDELFVQPVGASSMRRALKEPRINYTALKERHFRVLAELKKGMNANQVDLDAYKEQLDIEASYDVPVDITEEQLEEEQAGTEEEAVYDVLHEYVEREEISLSQLIQRVNSGELPAGSYYAETNHNEIEFKDNKIHFTNANLNDRFNVPVRKYITGGTVLPALVVLDVAANVSRVYENRSIESVVNTESEASVSLKFYTPVNGNMVMIWSVNA